MPSSTTLFKLPARYITQAHSVLAASAFAAAFVIGSTGYYKKLCKNGVAGYPQEWFPSVSATIGDHVPPRIVFQILIALCSGPRFMLVFLQYLVHRTTAPSTADHGEKPSRTEGRARWLAFVGVLRTFTCGGWVYITSTDHHDSHDFFMIMYLVLTIPWMLLSISAATQPYVRTRRIQIASLFFGTIAPMVYFFLRHSVQRVPGAYTYYSIFEWSLIFYDVAFDALGASEVTRLQIQVLDLGTASGDTESANTPGLTPPFKTTEPFDDGWKITTSEANWSGYRKPIAWLGDVFYAYAFWTVFTSLGLQLFYFSVWELALSGSEATLLFTLSPFFLANKWIASFASSRQGQITLRGATLVLGLGSYIIPGPGMRLIGVSLGTAAGWLSMAAGLGRLKGGRDGAYEGSTFALGLILAMTLKYVNKSTNPLWTVTDAASGGWNKTGLLVAGVYLWEYSTRPNTLHPAAPLVTSKKSDDVVEVELPHSTVVQRNAVAAGLGCLVFLLQMFVMDTGTIISWTWTGYTNGAPNGPTLHPYSGWVICAVGLGVLIGATDIPRSPLWVLLGNMSGWALYSFQDALGYYAGLGLVIYLTALIPLYFRAASLFPPGSTWGKAMALNAVLDVLSVVTAAYAFVPYGHLLRERTDLVLGASMIVLAYGASVADKAVARLAPSVTAEPPSVSNRLDGRYKVRFLSILLPAAVFAAFTLAKQGEVQPTPYFSPKSKVFSGGIFTVHFGLDEDARDSQYRMKQLIEEMQVDVLGLLETDLHRFVYGNRDLTRVMAEELGYYVDLGPGPNSHTWGAALLSKFPIINSTHHLLPSPHGELAPAIFATLDVFGTYVHVMVSHNGQEEDLLDRTLQTTEIARLLREKGEEPTVFLGYLVTRTGDKRPWPYQILMEDGNMLDIEMGDRWRWCEYIAFRGLWRVGFARVEEGTITDTELQVGKFKLPEPDHPAVYKDNKELYWHIGEENVPVEWRFPPQFRGAGVRGHKYRIWNGPLYYWPPGH